MRIPINWLAAKLADPVVAGEHRQLVDELIPTAILAATPRVTAVVGQSGLGEPTTPVAYRVGRCGVSAGTAPATADIGATGSVLDDPPVFAWEAGSPIGTLNERQTALVAGDPFRPIVTRSPSPGDLHALMVLTVARSDLFAVLQILRSGYGTPADTAIVGEAVMAALIPTELCQWLLGLAAWAVLHIWQRTSFP